MKKILILMLPCLLFCGVVQAQSEEYKREMSRFIEVSGGAAAYSSVVTQLLDAYKSAMPALPEEVWTEMAGELESVTGETMTDLLVPIYARYLTLEELTQLCDFYQTPVGLKYASVTPQIQAEALRSGMELGQVLSERVMERLRAKGYME